MTGQRTAVPAESAASGAATIGITIGALAVSTTGVFVALAQAPTVVSTFYRCALAVPVLVAVAWWETRRNGLLDRREAWLAIACGVFFAADMFLWGTAVLEAGAGLTTVLVNVQVVVVPLVAYLVDRELPGRRMVFALPVMVVGLIAASGVLQQGTTGHNPMLGAVHAILAGVCYSGFLFLLRRSGRQGRTMQTYAIAIVIPALAGLGWGLLRGLSSTLHVDGPALGWLALTALTGQGIGWLLIARYSHRVPSGVNATLLLLTPVGALLLGAVILGERPALLQIVGSALILAAAYGVSVRREATSAPQPISAEEPARSNR
ncbi:DMT family transporter [Nocardia sp. NPDC049149]|uniref:DMT family transporter n=1 Tax=Nocardia sp. NPDC049149 TaxID=3364315 RepID=UPI00371AC57F